MKSKATWLVLIGVLGIFLAGLTWFSNGGAGSSLAPTKLIGNGAEAADVGTSVSGDLESVISARADLRKSTTASAEVGDTSNVEVSAEEMDSKARKKRFTDAWHYRPLSVEAMTSPEFEYGQNDNVTSLRVITGLWGLTTQDFREVYAETEDEDLRGWAIMGTCFGEGLGNDDLAWVEGLAVQESKEPGVDQIAAIYAAREAASFHKLDNPEVLQRISGELLNQLGSDGASTLETNAALTLAFQATDELGGDLSLETLESYALNADASPELAGKCFEVLGRTGGAEGAQAVIGAALRGEPGALEGIRSLHDQSAIPELSKWIDAIGSPNGDDEIGLAAISGMLSTGSETALETFKDLMLGNDSLTPEQNEHRRQLALNAVEDLSDIRCRGLGAEIVIFKNAMWSDSEHPELESVAKELHRKLQQQRFVQSSVMFSPSSASSKEVAAGIRRVLVTLPPGDLSMNYLWSSLVKYGSAEDLAFVEMNAPPLAFQNMSQQLAHARARHRRDSINEASDAD